MREFVPFIVTECHNCGTMVTKEANKLYTCHTSNADSSDGPDILLNVKCPNCGENYTVNFSK